MSEEKHRKWGAQMRISQIVLWSYFTANNLGGEGSGGGGCMSPNQKGAIFILQINKLFFFPRGWHCKSGTDYLVHKFHWNACNKALRKIFYCCSNTALTLSWLFKSNCEKIALQHKWCNLSDFCLRCSRRSDTNLNIYILLSTNPVWGRGLFDCLSKYLCGSKSNRSL